LNPRRTPIAATVLLDTLRQGGERGLLLFLGNEESPCNYADNGYPYRQDSTYLYYFGIDHPGYAAVVDLDEGTATVFADDLDIDAIVWMGPQPSVAELAGSRRRRIAPRPERLSRNA
jgi:Xaa-Pro aminopeptidase